MDASVLVYAGSLPQYNIPQKFRNPNLKMATTRRPNNTHTEYSKTLHYLCILWVLSFHIFIYFTFLLYFYYYFLASRLL